MTATGAYILHFSFFEGIYILIFLREFTPDPTKILKIMISIKFHGIMLNLACAQRARARARAGRGCEPHPSVEVFDLRARACAQRARARARRKGVRTPP